MRSIIIIILVVICLIGNTSFSRISPDHRPVCIIWKDVPATDEFKSTVVTYTQSILDTLPPHYTFSVREGEPNYPALRVYIVAGIKKDHPKVAGEAKLDICDKFQHEIVKVYGEVLLARSTKYNLPDSYTAWMFANTIAHEIGHTIGYRHTDDMELSEQELNESVMRGVTRSLDLIRPRKFVVKQNHCPDLTSGQ